MFFFCVWIFKTKRCNKELFGAQKYNITYKTPFALYNTGPGILPATICDNLNPLSSSTRNQVHYQNPYNLTPAPQTSIFWLAEPNCPPNCPTQSRLINTTSSHFITYIFWSTAPKTALLSTLSSIQFISHCSLHSPRVLRRAPWGIRFVGTYSAINNTTKDTAITSATAGIRVVERRRNTHGLAHRILSTIIVTSGEQGPQRADD